LRLDADKAYNRESFRFVSDFCGCLRNFIAKNDYRASGVPVAMSKFGLGDYWDKPVPI